MKAALARPGRAVASLTFLSLWSGCGYQLAHVGHDPAGPYAVRGAPMRVADPVAVGAALAGARIELAASEQLATCSPEADGCAFVDVEILRVETTSEGIAVVRNDIPVGGPAGPVLETEAPLARALRVTVTGRASIRRGPSAQAERDTGDVSTSEVVARARDAPSGSLLKDDAARRAASRLGRRLIRHLLGIPEPTAE